MVLWCMYCEYDEFTPSNHIHCRQPYKVRTLYGTMVYGELESLHHQIITAQRTFAVWYYNKCIVQLKQMHFETLLQLAAE